MLLLSPVLVLMLLSSAAKCEMFTNGAELAKVFRLEQDLVGVLLSHKEQLENSLASLREYTSDVRNMYAREGCGGEIWPPKCTEQQFEERVLGNPIYNYQVIKRMIVYYKNVEAAMKEVDVKKTMGELRKVRHRHGVTPTEQDLHGAAKALNRLQEMYKLNMTEFTQGNIMGMQTAAELTIKDTFFLGRLAAMSNNPEMALRWLELASIQVAAEDSAADNSTSVTAAAATEASIHKPQIEQVLKQVKKKLPPGFKSASLVDEQEEEEDEIDGGRVYRLGNIPPKTHDPNKYQTVDDRINYKALCQGKDILPKSQRAKLKCFFSSENHPYFILNPLKVEEQHGEPHRMLTFHSLISDSEADELVKLAMPKMAHSAIGQEKQLSEIRVSRNAWLEDGIPLVDRLSRRFNMVTGLQTAKCYDEFQEGKLEEYEMLQIANYGIGGHYDLHQDPMFLYKTPDYLARLGDPAEHDYVTGDRMVTLMLYLSDVARGGLTAFPRLGVAVSPEKGSAVLWSNIKRSGLSDMHMIHGGCPVLLGTKWVANKWVREAANVLHRPCIDNIDV